MLHDHPSENGRPGAGVLGLEPRMRESESLVLPITPYPIGYLGRRTGRGTGRQYYRPGPRPPKCSPWESTTSSSRVPIRMTGPAAAGTSGPRTDSGTGTGPGPAP